MRLLYYLGVALLIVTFVVAAAEMASHAMPGEGRGFIVSARDLWYTFRPKSLLIFEMRLNRLAPGLLDPYVLGLLKLPAWVIFGVPGLFLVYKFRPPGDDHHDDEIRALDESFELFDKLTREARAEQKATGTTHEIHGPQDLLPDHLMGEDLAPDANLPDDFEAGELPPMEDK